MSERLVEIPVHRAVRDKLKEVKGTMSYSEFLENIISKMLKGESNERI
jgi:hypothetical protein